MTESKRDFFWQVYALLAESGVCDDPGPRANPGGIEFDQVYADWLEDGAHEATVEAFIRERANLSGWFAPDGTPVPAEVIRSHRQPRKTEQ